MMKILIVGGCGFVGGNLAVMFTADGHDVRVVDNMSRSGTELNARRLLDHGITMSRSGVKEFAAAGGFRLWTPDIILNCAAQSRSMLGIGDPAADFYGNVESTFYCLELARQYNAALVHWSTNKVYSDYQVNEYNATEGETRYQVDYAMGVETLAAGRHTVYGATKIAAEALIDEWSRLYGIPCIRNRFSCIAGPHQYGCSDQGWVALWMIHHYLEKPLTYFGFNGKQVRDVLNISDLYELIKRQAEYLTATDQPVNQIYNVGGGMANTLSLRECSELCERITGNHLTIGYNPEPRWADQRVFVSDNSKVSDAFNWEPTRAPAETLADIHSWIVDNESTVREFYG